MIIPIGHEESEVRRLPWVTIAIMAICVLRCSPRTRRASSPTRRPSRAALQQAAAYWRDRPYLDAPPEVVIEVSYDVAPNQRTQYIGMLKTNVDPPRRGGGGARAGRARRDPGRRARPAESIASRPSRRRTARGVSPARIRARSASSRTCSCTRAGST